MSVMENFDAVGPISAIAAIVAAIGAIWAAVVARAARRDVQRYNDAFWAIEYAGPIYEGDNFRLKITNTGNTRAVDLVLVWDFDPFGFYGAIVKADVVEPEETVLQLFRVLRERPTLWPFYSEPLTDADRAARRGVATWTNVLGKRVTQVLFIPMSTDINIFPLSRDS